MINKIKKEQNFSKYNSFHSSISEDMETAILLLQSEDKSTLLAAIEALSKYASKSKDNAKLLFHLGIVNNVLPILEHEDIFIRRFVQKLICSIDTIKNINFGKKIFIL